MNLARISSPFLEGLDCSDRKIVLAAAREQRFLTNSIIANQGNSANYLFLLTKGRARYFFLTQEGKKVILIWLPPGEVFGLRTLLPKSSPYLCSTETVKDSSVLVWDRAKIRALAARYPRLIENALSTASTYFDWYLATHLALIGSTARQRLARVLINLSRGIGREIADGIELDATNEELASAANITPFTASRLLSEWQRNRTVVKRRAKILLRSPEQLFSSGNLSAFAQHF